MTPTEFRAIRRQAGLTQARLAPRIGVTTNTVARYEQGKLPVPGPVAILMRLLQIEVSDETRV